MPMHNAPPVSYPVGRSRFSATLLILIWSLGTTGLTLWFLQSPMPLWGLAAAGLLHLAAGLTAARFWWRAPCGELSWDAQGWTWTSAGHMQCGCVHVGVDLQTWLLLRLSAGEGSLWIGLERRACADRWDDLRRALYSPARPRSQRQGQLSVVTP